MHTFTEEEIASVKGIRDPRVEGGKYEVTVYHATLPKCGKTQVFREKRDAAIWKLTELSLLNSNQVRSALVKTESETRNATAFKRHVGRPLRVVVMLREYMDRGPNVTHSAKIAINSLRNEKVIDVAVSEIDHFWVDSWIAHYKKGIHRIRPDSIKKKVGLLRAALDWYHREYFIKAGLPRPDNPLRDLPDGYANHDIDDPERLVNTKRDRRLKQGEEAAIINVIRGVTMRRCRRPVNNPVQTLMIWRLIVNTGLRLREAYRLRMRALKGLETTGATVLVEDSKLTREGKRDGKRTVPLTRTLRLELLAYIEEMGLTQGSDEPLFSCWWNGETDKNELDIISNKLSQMFAALHRDAGATGLREHDLRHEATSRWCEMRLEDGRRMYSKDEVMSFTGHTEESTFAIYLHFFMADLTPEAMQARVAA